MVNLEWYRTFKAIYEKGTLTAAAEALFISQPGVSLHLSSLENQMGTKLFERINKNMRATEQGKILYNALQEPMNELLSIESRFQRSTKNHTPSISIGMCFETFQHSLERHLHTLEFNVITQFSDYRDLLHKLEHGDIDLVVTPQKSNNKEIKHIELGQENIVLIASNNISKSEFDTIIKQGKKITKNWLLQHKWYGTASDNEHFKKFWKINFGKTPNFRQNYIVPNFSSIIRSLSYGSGLAIVPDFLCNDAIQNHDLQILWKGNHKITNTLYFAYRINTPYIKQLEQLLHHLKSDLSNN